MQFHIIELMLLYVLWVYLCFLLFLLIMLPQPSPSWVQNANLVGDG